MYPPFLEGHDLVP